MGEPGREWSPAIGLVVIGWLLALGAAAWCATLWLTGADPAGRLIAGVAAVAAAAAALFGSRARPRLQADAGGLTVGGIIRARHHPWPFVKDLRLLRTRRLGRDTVLLEVDTVNASGDERLLVFGRLDLDADPEDVLAELRLLRP
jgi:hypothetical protein